MKINIDIENEIVNVTQQLRQCAHCGNHYENNHNDWCNECLRYAKNLYSDFCFAKQKQEHENKILERDR